MEFSLDSYDWVMINNVYSMGLYSDGGLSTTKPYISSSNYISKCQILLEMASGIKYGMRYIIILYIVIITN